MIAPGGVAECPECGALSAGDALAWALDHLRETGHRTIAWEPV